MIKLLLELLKVLHCKQVSNKKLTMNQRDLPSQVEPFHPSVHPQIALKFPSVQVALFLQGFMSGAQSSVSFTKNLQNQEIFFCSFLQNNN